MLCDLLQGIITAVSFCEETNLQTATVALSDERKKIQIPWEEVQEYFLDKDTAGACSCKCAANVVSYMPF